MFTHTDIKKHVQRYTYEKFPLSSVKFSCWKPLHLLDGQSWSSGSGDLGSGFITSFQQQLSAYSKLEIWWPLGGVNSEYGAHIGSG